MLTGQTTDDGAQVAKKPSSNARSAKKRQARYPEFAARFRDAAVLAGLSNAEIARRLEISAQSVQRWSDGTGRPARASGAGLFFC